MADEPEYSLGLTTTLRETGGRALEAGKPLPRRFAQLAKDLDRRCFHQANKRQRANRVKRGARLSRRAPGRKPSRLGQLVLTGQHSIVCVGGRSGGRSSEFVNVSMTRDLFAIEYGNTELTPEEKLALIPSLSTRAELNAFERANIHAARVWAMRPRNLTRPDLLTDSFSRELHKRMFNQVWRWAELH